VKKILKNHKPNRKQIGSVLAFGPGPSYHKSPLEGDLPIYIMPFFGLAKKWATTLHKLFLGVIMNLQECH